MKVIIIGAGIGGLTTAIALQQRKIDYAIYDAAPGNLPLGAGIMLGVNAMRVYDRLGIGDIIKQAAVLPEYINIGNDHGEILQTIQNNKIACEFGTGTYGIHRATLQALLLDRVKQPVNWGKRFRSVIENADNLTVHFDDGTTAQGTVLVGADGIRSAVREQFVEKAQYRYSGQTCWRATLPIDLPAEELLAATEVWSNQGGGLRAMYTQVGPQQVYFWMTTCMPAGMKMPPEQALQFIKQQLAGFPGYMQKVLQQLRPEWLIPGDLYDLAPLKCWHRNRVVLLGDAAHATTPNMGQGAGQAIEDAWVLAQCLSRESSYRQAFINYEHKRRKRAQKIVQLSWQLAWLTNWKGPWRTRLRNNLMKRMPGWMMQKQLTFLYGVQLDD